MTTEFMEVDRDWEVGRAIREIRRQCEDKESLSQLFVTDEFRHLEGRSHCATCSPQRIPRSSAT